MGCSWVLSLSQEEQVATISRRDIFMNIPECRGEAEAPPGPQRLQREVLGGAEGAYSACTSEYAGTTPHQEGLPGLQVLQWKKRSRAVFSAPPALWDASREAWLVLASWSSLDNLRDSTTGDQMDREQSNQCSGLSSLHSSPQRSLRRAASQWLCPAARPNWSTEVNNRREAGKFTNTWKLNSMLLK